MLNVGRAIDLMELYVGREINPKLAREILNLKARNFAARTGSLSSKITISSVADTQEYELPLGVVHIKDIIYDDHRAYKIQFYQVKELQNKV